MKKSKTLDKNIKSEKKRKESESVRPSVPSLKWDPDAKEPWLLEFEKEPVNDERWSCLVTAAIPAEVQDEECIQIYRKCVATGLRRAIKIISMADIMNIIGSNSNRPPPELKDKKQKSKQSKVKIKVSEDFSTKLLQQESPVIELARKYVTYTDTECQLPPTLMAAVVKHLVLLLKEEDIRQKKINYAKARRNREHKLKLKFISEMKQYEVKERKESNINVKPTLSNLLGVTEPIDDEPTGGPDLYIILIDFYNPFYFTELQNLNVPFLALLQITGIRETQKASANTFGPSDTMTKLILSDRKSAVVSNFWLLLKTNCSALETSNFFKNILLIEFHMRPLKNTDTRILYNLMFDELTWLQYSTYNIYRQHQKYLKEMLVQRMILSLEPLDLSRCELYNNLCDILITGEPTTVLLVLYAIIEQVVVGVPHTDSVPVEYDFQVHDFFKKDEDIHSSSESDSDASETKKLMLVTPCLECRNKMQETFSDICEKPKPTTASTATSGNREESENTQKKSNLTSTYEGTSTNSYASSQSKRRSKTPTIRKYPITDNLINEILLEKNAEKETQNKKWQTPVLNLYGDFVSFGTFHCDKRLIDTNTIYDRFLKNANISRLWVKYPKLPPEKRAYFNYQFIRLLHKTNICPDFLKLKIYFALSVKLIGVTNSEIFKGDADFISDIFGSVLKERLKKLSLRTDQAAFSLLSKTANNRMSYYKFIKVTVDRSYKEHRRTTFKLDSYEQVGRFLAQNPHFRQKAVSHFNVFLTIHRSSGAYFPYSFKIAGETLQSYGANLNEVDSESVKLFNILDSVEISNLPEYNFLSHKEEYLAYIGELKYYESLEPNRMVQRLMEAQDKYNTVQCLYFPPTDTLIVLMHNDSDHRGLFYTFGYGRLATPVMLRDFYKYVYPEISDWLTREENENNLFLNELRKRESESEDKKDRKYLSHLQKKFQSLTEDEKAIFIKINDQPLQEEEIQESLLQDLPKKIKDPTTNRISFYGTNLADIQIETQRNIQEYFSKDGTEINFSVDYWVHEPIRLSCINIKKSKLRLVYHHCLGQEKLNTDFTLITTSDMIFYFYKPQIEEETPDVTSPSQYNLKISWPTGLLIQSAPHPALGVYVKQSYIKVYRRDWDIKDEKLRCYLKNGQILIFKENGTVDILCGSGTIINLHEFEVNPEILQLTVPKFDLTNATGEVWEKPSKGPCRNQKKLINTHKIYMGTDKETLETYYRRDDGVNFMLWPSGKLVTTFPDGTKITSVPKFGQEIIVEWETESGNATNGSDIDSFSVKSKKAELSSQTSEEEKDLYFEKNSRDSGEDFVTVVISYLLEHPKYATVSFVGNEQRVCVNMPDELSVSMYFDGCYKVRQKSQVLSVREDGVEFYTDCRICPQKSIVTLKFDNECLCKCVDFFNQEVWISQSGQLLYKDETKNEAADKNKKEQKKETKKYSCIHLKNIINNQRCFAFERDLSGVEILHSDFLANYCYNLSEDAYYDLDSKHPKEALISHTFSDPHAKVGYENWEMEYEDQKDGLPTNLKKKDLKEQGKKENSNKLYQHPFPRKQEWDLCANRQVTNKTQINMPKIIVARTVKCISDKPFSIIHDLQLLVNDYQAHARALFEKYKTLKVEDKEAENAEITIAEKLKNISLALNPPTYLHPYIRNITPSTEKECHGFGHGIKFRESIKSHFQGDTSNLPQCKYIPRSLPRKSFFHTLPEEEIPRMPHS